MNNIRYITATHIGMWAMDKHVRFCLLPQGDEPIMWDFGSAARHHKIYSPWLGEDRSRAGISTLRGSVKGRAEAVAEKIRVELEQRGLLDQPLGVDIVELPVLRALEAAGITVVDGQALMQDIRMIKTVDEITLLNTACSMVDAAYDELFRALKPGIRENDCVALVSKLLFELGSEHIEGINAISGERCSPHPHVFTDRMLRPGDPAYFDILHAYNGYRTCYYRTFAVGSASPALVDAYKRCRDILDHAISLIRPGVTTAEVVEVLPKAQEFGFADEEAAFALQYGHGVGLSSWEKPIFSRLVSFDYPETIEEGMVFALETFWPATDGWQAARIEEQLVVTPRRVRGDHALPGRGAARRGLQHYTVGGQLPGIRETQSHLNNPSLATRSPQSARVEAAHLDAGRGDHADARDGAGDGQGRPLAQGRRRGDRRGRAAARDRDRQGDGRDRGARIRDARRGLRGRRRRRAGRAGDRVRARGRRARPRRAARVRPRRPPLRSRPNGAPALSCRRRRRGPLASPKARRLAAEQRHRPRRGRRLAARTARSSPPTSPRGAGGSGDRARCGG